MKAPGFRIMVQEVNDLASFFSLIHGNFTAKNEVFHLGFYSICE